MTFQYNKLSLKNGSFLSIAVLEIRHSEPFSHDNFAIDSAMKIYVRCFKLRFLGFFSAVAYTLFYALDSVVHKTPTTYY